MASDGRMIRVESQATAVKVVQAAQCRCFTREAVMTKSLAAWVLDAVWSSLTNKRDGATYAALRREFAGFQRQTVLETVTPIALYNLVRDTALHTQVRSVRWNGKPLRFEVE